MNDFMRFLYYWLVQIPFVFIVCTVIILGMIAIVVLAFYYVIFVLCFFTGCYVWLL